MSKNQSWAAFWEKLPAVDKEKYLVRLDLHLEKLLGLLHELDKSQDSMLAAGRHPMTSGYYQEISEAYFLRFYQLFVEGREFINAVVAEPYATELLQTLYKRIDLHKANLENVRSQVIVHPFKEPSDKFYKQMRKNTEFQISTVDQFFTETDDLVRQLCKVLINTERLLKYRIATSRLTQ